MRHVTDLLILSFLKEKKYKRIPRGEIKKRKGLFRYKVFLYRAFILEQSSLDEMKGI